MDIERAMVEVTGVRQVRICVPPWIVTARVAQLHTGRPILADLCVQHEEGITAARLATLPVRQITMLAAEAMWGAEETIYRMSATPLSPGMRSHPPEHYRRVARVAEWATRSARPGGPAVCVAQFWDVHVRTARRWLARARSGAAER